MLERARELVEPYIGRAGVLGAYVVGSASRPFRDGFSDYDIEVVLEDDAFAAVPDAERHVFVMDEGPPRKVDHEFYLRPWSELAGLRDSTRDLDHYPFQHAMLLHDTDGRLEHLLAGLAAMPEETRRLRLRVHYLEYVSGTARAVRCGLREAPENARLVAGDALTALVKLLFVLHGSWASTRHWSTQELELLGVPGALLDQLGAALADPTEGAIRELTAAVQAHLEGHDWTDHKDRMALFRWAFLTPEGKGAFAEWAAR